MNNNRIKFLIGKLKQGKSKYFNEFYNLTKIGVYYQIKKIVYSKETTEEVMQESYITFLNTLNKIDEEKNAYSYLLTISKNKAIDYYRKFSKIDYEEFIDIIPSEEKPNFLFDCPLLEYSKRHLTNEEWEILELTVIMGYRRVEVAKNLNVPISTLNYQYNKILKKVKEFYKEVYNEN